MIISIVLLGYFAAAILGARYKVYQTMLINERAKYVGKQLEARLYSKSDFVRMASKSDRFRFRSVSKSDVPASDYTGVVFAGLFWWAYLIGGIVKVLVMNGHKKTPGQREAAVKAREEAAEANEARIAELEKKNNEELDRKLREAGIKDV